VGEVCIHVGDEFGGVWQLEELRAGTLMASTRARVPSRMSSATERTSKA